MPSATVYNHDVCTSLTVLTTNAHLLYDYKRKCWSAARETKARYCTQSRDVHGAFQLSMILWKWRGNTEEIIWKYSGNIMN